MINSEKYCYILNDLFEAIEKSDWQYKNSYHLQWDGAPAHSSEKVSFITFNFDRFPTFRAFVVSLLSLFAVNCII